MDDHRRCNGIEAYHSCLILLLLIIVLTLSVAAADTMFSANPEHTGVYDNGGIEPNNSELWWFATGGNVQSSPAVSNGIVFGGTMR